MENRVAIGQLTASSVSRNRGAEAFQCLKSHLSSGEVVIDFTGKELISISFVDELVLRLAESDQLNKVTFVLDTNALRDKFAHVASLREACIFVRKAFDQPKTLIQPKKAVDIVLQKSCKKKEAEF